MSPAMQKAVRFKIQCYWRGRLVFGSRDYNPGCTLLTAVLKYPSQFHSIHIGKRGYSILILL